MSGGHSILWLVVLAGRGVTCRRWVRRASSSCRDPEMLIGRETFLRTFLRKRRQSFLKSEGSTQAKLIPAKTEVIQGVSKGLIRRVF